MSTFVEIIHVLVYRVSIRIALAVSTCFKKNSLDFKLKHVVELIPLIQCPVVFGKYIILLSQSSINSSSCVYF